MKNNGFTLIELLIVIAIIAILSIMGASSFRGIVNNAQDAKRKADVNAIAKALEVHYDSANQQYLPLQANWFGGGSIPTPPEGGNYNVTPSSLNPIPPDLGSPSTSGFQVYDTLSDGTTYYVNRSSQLTYAGSLPGPSSSPSPAPSSSPSPSSAPVCPPKPAALTGCPSPGINVNWDNTAICQTPVNDLGTGSYNGFPGGLYPGGSNIVPGNYLSYGTTAAGNIKPLDSSGGFDPTNGKIVLLTVGMSNTRIETDRFITLGNADTSKNSNVVIVNGAQNGVDVEAMTNPSNPNPLIVQLYHNYWDPGKYLDTQISNAGITKAQVQAIWLKQALAKPAQYGGFPAATIKYQSDLQALVDKLTTTFTNLQIIYISSRIYAGYAGVCPSCNDLNPEPYSYETGFGVKWLIENKINIPTFVKPWIAWGPYTWADGLRARSDGTTWTCNDLNSGDGTHPSNVNPTYIGTTKMVNTFLLPFFKGDSTAKSWFCKSGSCGNP